MTKSVDFIFDFASLNAYLAYAPLKVICARRQAQLNIIPCLLGGIFKATNNQAPMVAFANIKNKMQYEMLEVDRFIKRHGFTRYRMNPHFPVNTLSLMRGLVAAEMDGKKEPYIEAGLRAMWEDGENMADPPTIIRVLTAAGLDGARYVARAGEADVKQRLMNNTESAVARGAFGVPTFFVGSEMFFGKERLGQLEELLSH